jgi:flagellar biosynthesis protein FlhF
LPNGTVEISAAVDSPAKETQVDFGLDAKKSNGNGKLKDSRDLSELTKKVEGLGLVLERHLMMSEAAAGFSARPEIAPIYDHLTGQEILPDIVRGLLDGLASRQGHGLLPRLSIRLKKAFQVNGPPKVSTKGPTIWALVGPTGVGKTTTLAKLAATFALRHNLAVGMITVDTFRMAAAEQLKVYGRIMEVQTLVAATSEELTRAVKRLGGSDIILIDTVGRSPEDEGNLEELKSILASVPGVYTHLVLACPTREADQDRIYNSFARFDPQSLIFSKLDETGIYGSILNRVVRTGLPVSYLTTGQRVPDDLEEATREGLARRLLPPRKDLKVFDE